MKVAHIISKENQYIDNPKGLSCKIETTDEFIVVEVEEFEELCEPKANKKRKKYRQTN